MKAHSNIDLLKTDFSEGFQLRNKFDMQTKIDWRSFAKNEPYDNKAKKALKEFKSECNKNYNNEVVVRYKAY